MENNEKASQILAKIEVAKKILVLTSKPIDTDSLGTTLSVRWWLKKKGKDVRACVFSNIPEHTKAFPDIDQIEQRYVNEVDFQEYDLIILVDGNAFRQFFTSQYRPVVRTLDKNKLICIDHHEPDEILEELGNNYFGVVDSCTAKVFFDYFVEPSGIKLDSTVAQYMYMALIGDTGVFRYALYSDTFAFAQTLFDAGVDHFKATDWSMPKAMMEFTAWAIQNTTYYPNLQSTILEITDAKYDELNRIFGDDWEASDLSRYYKNVFIGMVKGYPYGLILTTVRKNPDAINTKLEWRAKNFNAPIDLMQTFQNAGFVARGHKKAGGGTISVSVEEAVKKFSVEMAIQLEK